MVEEHTGTKERTCCVGLSVWGVVRWQACLLLHYSVLSCVEVSQLGHLLGLQFFTCEWMRDHSGTWLIVL